MELVQRRLDALPIGAAGCASMPSAFSVLADTMGAWRFFNNLRTSFAELLEPLREASRLALQATGAPVVLLVQDRCKLSDPGQTTKKDQAELSQGNNCGYELTTVLAVDGSDDVRG